MKRHLIKLALSTLSGLVICNGVAMAQNVATKTSLSFTIDTPISDVQIKCVGMKIVQTENSYICTPEAQPTQPSDNMASIIADMEKENLRNDPIQAGIEGNREALRRLPSVTPAAHEERINAKRSLYQRYKAIDASAAHGENKINYDLLGFVLEQELALADFDEARIPFTNDSGFFNMMSYVSRQTKFGSVEDYEAYAARLSELPRYFEEQKANLRRGIATDYTASAEILPGIIEMVKALSIGTPEDHSFYQPFTSFNDLIPVSEQSRLKKLGRAAVSEDILPAYADLLEFLESEYAPKARKIVGIGTNQQNRELYKTLVKHFTTLDISPDEVHQIGLDEVKRIRSEMNEVIAETGFEGDFKSFLNFLRTDKQFYVDTPEALLKEAAWIAKRVDGQMPKYFGKLPRLSYGVLPVPDEIAPSYTTGRYWGGNPDNGVAGNYMVNTYNLTQRPLYNLPALTLHEGVPGHHHQISLGQELQDVPKFRQSLYPNAFGEGWGLYSEKLGVEMGIYQTPYENFGRLTYEMWRACRLVVDTGMHWKGWTREQAEACFFENSALAAHNIKTEVDRYISWPGQALAYKIGELKIWELRRLAEAELGANFDIRKFHDAVLGNGGIPLKVLEEQIKIWIKEQKSG